MSELRLLCEIWIDQAIRAIIHPYRKNVFHLNGTAESLDLVVISHILLKDFERLIYPTPALIPPDKETIS